MRDKLFRWWPTHAGWLDVLVAWLVVISVMASPSYTTAFLGAIAITALLRSQKLYIWMTLAQNATDLTEKVLAVNEQLIARLPEERHEVVH